MALIAPKLNFSSVKPLGSSVNLGAPGTLATTMAQNQMQRQAPQALQAPKITPAQTAGSFKVPSVNAPSNTAGMQNKTQTSTSPTGNLSNVNTNSFFGLPIGPSSAQTNSLNFSNPTPTPTKTPTPVVTPVKTATPVKTSPQTSYQASAMQNYVAPPVVPPPPPPPPVNVPGDVSTNTFGKNENNLYNANAPLDMKQFNPFVDTINNTANKIAETQNTDANYKINLEDQARKNPTTGDFYNNNLGFEGRQASTQLSNLSNIESAAEKTLATKLALAQAERTGAKEQAQVPFDVNKPVSVAPGTSLVNPFNGNSVNGGLQGGSIDTLASDVANGKTSYDQAVSTLGAYANDPKNLLALQTAIKTKNPNFNISQSNGAAAGIADTASGQTAQTQSLKSSLQQGQNLQTQFTDLVTKFGLNPSDINAVNRGIQTIAKNTSSTQYQVLSNYINDIANTYAQVLTPSGGAQTDTTRQIATSMLDASAKGQSLLDVMKGLDAAAQAKIAGVPTLGAGSSGGSGSTGSNSPFTGSAWK